jgi:putative endonuclease
VSNMPSSWFVYILRCSDKSLYTGITTNLAKRLDEHNHSAKGAKYTRGRRPVSLLYSEQHPSRSDAASREHEIKHLKKKEKEQLIKDTEHAKI